MSFKSILDTIGNDAKKVFSFLSSSKGQAIVTTVETAVTDIDPTLSGIFTIVNSWMSEIFKTQALASAAAATTGSSTQKAAIALSSITPQVLSFAQANGLNTPTAADLSTINNALVTVLNTLGAGTVAASTPVVPTASNAATSVGQAVANPTVVTNASL